jgi:hypothetical protein
MAIKKHLLVIAVILMSCVRVWAQSLSSTVISSGGDFYSGTTTTLSVTIGEPVAETYSSATLMLGTGFQQSDLLKQLKLTLYLQGLWNGNGLNKAQGSISGQYPGNIADKIAIELHHATNYNNIVYSVTGINLSTSGQATLSIPGTKSGSYFLSVKHRNSIETVSAAPVSFSGLNVSYSFADNVNKAYGENLKLLSPGIYGFFSGDINGDGAVNSLDLTGIINASNNFSLGYAITDINGDGIADAMDLIQADNNAALFVSAKKP